MLLALAGVDWDDLVGEAGLFKEEGNLRGVGGRVEIEPDHGVSFGESVVATWLGGGLCCGCCVCSRARQGHTGAATATLRG